MQDARCRCRMRDVVSDLQGHRNFYPACACASKGLCDRSWRLYIVVVYCIYIVYKSALFFGTNLLSPKILTLRCLF